MSAALKADAEGFPPVAGAGARVLVLGSLPGQRSLAEQQYYAHPRNAFWPIMRALFDIDGGYRERCEQLVENHIALWDVLASSYRPGSLDADIHLDSARANDFHRFFQSHREIGLIAFNGKTAARLFQRFVAGEETAGIEQVTLPSTSPAYAAMRFSGKLSAWRSALG